MLTSHRFERQPSTTADGVHDFVMPTLVKAEMRVQCTPPALADALPDGPWTVIHVRSRQDTLIMEDLRYLGIASLAFFEYRTRRYASGLQRMQVPLLPGYVFAVADRDRMDDIARTERAVTILKGNDDVALAMDLHRLIRVVRLGATAWTVAPHLVPGSTVTINRGRYHGCEGVVVRRTGLCYLAINLTQLERSIEVEIDAAGADAFTPLPPSHPLPEPKELAAAAIATSGFVRAGSDLPVASALARAKARGRINSRDAAEPVTAAPPSAQGS